jgi:hypothetical protein
MKYPSSLTFIQLAVSGVFVVSLSPTPRPPATTVKSKLFFSASSRRQFAAAIVAGTCGFSQVVQASEIGVEVEAPTDFTGENVMVRECVNRPREKMRRMDWQYVHLSV